VPPKKRTVTSPAFVTASTTNASESFHPASMVAVGIHISCLALGSCSHIAELRCPIARLRKGCVRSRSSHFPCARFPMPAVRAPGWCHSRHACCEAHASLDMADANPSGWHRSARSPCVPREQAVQILQEGRSCACGARGSGRDR
jgi:hypothetical protein